MPNFFINVKEKGAKKAELNIKGLTKAIGGMAIGFAAANKAMDFLKKSVTMSAEMEGVRRGFDNLAKSSGFSSSAFNKLKTATDGTVASMELMKQANNAMLLGIADSEEQMANMFDIAQRLGQSLGVDTVSAVESLVTGLGRQSKLMLDNLGIMVDTNKAYADHAASLNKSTSELTDQERKQAFVNAAMSEANSLVGQLGDEQLTTKDAIAQVATATEGLAIKFGDVLSPSIVKIADVLSTFITGTADFLDWADGINSVAEAQDRLNVKQERANKWFNEIAKNVGFTSNSFNGLLENMLDLRTFIEDFIAENTAGSGLIAFLQDAQSGVGYWKTQLSTLNYEIGIFNDQIQESSKHMEDNLMINFRRIAGNESWIKSLKKRKVTSIDAAIAEGELRKENLKSLVSSTVTVQQEIRKQIQAKFANMIAGLLERVIGTKGLFGLALAPLAAAGAAQLFNTVVPRFETGGLIGGQSHAQGGTMINAERGEFVMSRDAVESIGVNYLERMNEGGGGNNITVNVSGNVLTQDFVEDELAESIRTAVRRGTDFGIS